MPVIAKNYNYRLSSARMTIENSFGRLKVRWRVLLKKPDLHVDTMRKVIYVCMLLHNFCENNKEIVPQTWMDEVTEEERLLHEGGNRPEVVETQNPGGKQKRAIIAQKLFNDNLSII